MRARPTINGPVCYIRGALKRALHGAEVNPDDLRAAMPASGGLSKLEQEAWEQLGLWTEQADMRARDENYAKFHRDWLTDLHARLSR